MHLPPRRGIARPLHLPLLATLLVGCGGGDGQTSGGAFQATAHPPLPQVVSLGGPVLTHPKVLPIMFAGDPGAADVQAFLNELAGSAAWG